MADKSSCSKSQAQETVKGGIWDSGVDFKLQRRRLVWSGVIDKGVHTSPGRLDTVWSTLITMLMTKGAHPVSARRGSVLLLQPADTVEDSRLEEKGEGPFPTAKGLYSP